jgi:hypothetical protein
MSSVNITTLPHFQMIRLCVTVLFCTLVTTYGDIHSFHEEKSEFKLCLRFEVFIATGTHICGLLSYDIM